MDLTIDLFCNDGSPIGLTPPDIYGKGVGGAELAMMSWAETMAGRGHRVRVYNDPSRDDCYDGVYYQPKGNFRPAEGRDVFILFRSPNPTLRAVQANYKIHWSTDQYTTGNFSRDIVPYVDKVVCISPFHADYYRSTYGGDIKVGYIDLGVRLGDYSLGSEKIPGRCIFCSVPDRGLELLHLLWPKIKERAPEANLVITSDYRLWGAPGPRNHQHRLQWINEPDVTFLGKVERHRLVKEQLAAVCQPYPCTYEELFCISAAECQVAGAMPVTSPTGALQTTNEWGAVIEGNMMDGGWQIKFIDSVIEAMGQDSQKMQQQARKRFSWERICQQWERLIETGEFA